MVSECMTSKYDWCRPTFIDNKIMPIILTQYYQLPDSIQHSPLFSGKCVHFILTIPWNHKQQYKDHQY